MASDRSFVEFVADQVSEAGDISYRMMFGEYALYSGRKVILLICDNRVFVKPTEGGRAFIGDVVEAPAYPGAKPSFLIEDRIEDREWMTELVRITANELPEPKPKKSEKKAVRKKKGDR
ncbi:MAG TPA: TfoX/Sxy family protein [Spirochaetota bacterium]|nr:TfoX/Sxy family protein [Spirochaetota bacterium]